MAISVFLADNRGMVRDGLGFLLQAQDDISVVGNADSGPEAVREVRRLRPDIVLIDMAMPELNGIDAASEIRKSNPSTGVVVLSMLSAAEHVFRALQAGARGYLLMDASSAELVEAVRTVHAGQRYLSPNVAGAVIDDYLRDNHEASPLDSLSRRERQILQLVAEGKSSACAAKILFLSPKTVETYRSRLMRNLGVGSFSSLIKFAIQHGVVTQE